MTIVEERLALLDSLHLGRGSHSSFEDGVCVMEAVAWVAGEPHSDHPKCASKLITAFMVSWNDSLRSDEERDRLVRPLVPLLVGTRTTAKDETTRAWLATDWLVREQAPAWLRLAGLVEHAHALENLAALTGRKQAVVAQPSIAAADSAAYAASRTPAYYSAAVSAAYAAARSAAYYSSAYAAARSAADSALEPTVTLLQDSAVLLVKRMCEVGR